MKPSDIKIITLCGSTKFYEETEKVATMLSKNGYLVLKTSFYSQSRDKDLFDSMTPQEQNELVDRFVHEHCMMIYMSSGIYVINPNGYIGESTKKEIEYAKSLGKFVMYMEAPTKNG
jgi:hypothetical protein